MRGGGGASHPNAAIVYTSAQYRDMYNFFLYLEKIYSKNYSTVPVSRHGVPLECPRREKSGTLFSPRVRQWT